jgi:2-succinyl-5-enolpyruvyl-6-hydroxy-3-cyclohexene-1-carboxylate synthase
VSTYDYYGAFFEELADRGLRDVVCSPGSRSTPLILCADAERRLRCQVQVDERSAGYFALGLAKAQRRAVALICTSGSAAANFLPAITEAFFDGVALVVLTADRPPELRDRGAGQTIDQIRLYGDHVRWSADLPVPDEVDTDHARYAARRAVAAAVGPPRGPVHLNVPLREPLEPPAGMMPGRHPEPAGAGPIDNPDPAPAAVAAPVEAVALARLVRGTDRGLLAVGPSDLPAGDVETLKRLAAVAGWPVIADAASGVRAGISLGATVVAGGHHLASADAFWERHRPDVIVRIGHPTAGRTLREGLAAWGSETWLVDPLDRWEEPTTVPAGLWRSPIGALSRATLELLDAAGGDPVAAAGRAESSWVRSWSDAEATTQRTITEVLAAGPFLEAGLARSLGEMLGEGTILYVSNSMPVRDMDAFGAPHPNAPRIVAHRGTNGIDGVVSAAAGAATCTAPVVLLAGDLALLHDIGGLLGAARLGVDMTIVVPNNDGGGIFSFLPIAGTIPDATFKRFFLTPHGTDLAALMAGLGIRHMRATNPSELHQALEDSQAAPGIGLIEVPIEAAANVAQHRDVEQAIRAALAGIDRSPREA